MVDMDNRKEDHTFAICAYKESPFLEECILSLKRQTLKSQIIMATSTPNDYIKNLADRYDIALYINKGKSGITQDWNFAYSCAQSKYVTIAHQDDIYDAKYVEKALQLVMEEKRPLIYFCDYYELRDGRVVKSNTLLRTKRFMLLPLKIQRFRKSKWIRRRILSFGSPICCPAVMYVKPNLPSIIFKNGFRSCEDWEAWEMISKLTGSFVYEKNAYVFHRIHEGSETSAIIGDNARSAEELEMYKKFWPVFIAKIINRQYAKGQKSNGMDK